MPTLQEMVMSGKIRAPDTNVFVHDVHKLYMQACVDEIFDMCTTRDGDGWIAVCRKSGDRELYGIQYDFYSPGRGISTMAVNDYRRARSAVYAKILIKASEEDWDNEYRIARTLIEHEVEGMDVKHICPDEFEISDPQKRIIRRNLLSEYRDGHKDVRIFFSVDLPPLAWVMSAKPTYNFIAFYDFPYVREPFRIMSDDTNTNSDIILILSDVEISAYYEWESNGIKTRLPGVFREAVWKVFDEKVRETLRLRDRKFPVKLLVRESGTILYLADYKDSPNTWSITSSGFHRYPLSNGATRFAELLERAILGTDGGKRILVDWFCSDEEKESIISDTVILRLGADDV